MSTREFLKELVSDSSSVQLATISVCATVGVLVFAFIPSEIGETGRVAVVAGVAMAIFYCILAWLVLGISAVQRWIKKGSSS